jgi:hypothetical protein
MASTRHFFIPGSFITNHLAMIATAKRYREIIATLRPSALD